MTAVETEVEVEWIGSRRVAELTGLSRGGALSAMARGSFGEVRREQCAGGRPQLRVHIDMVIGFKPMGKGQHHRLDAVVEDAEFLISWGCGPIETTRRCGYDSWASFVRALERAGRNDLVARLVDDAKSSGYNIDGKPLVEGYQRNGK